MTILDKFFTAKNILEIDKAKNSRDIENHVNFLFQKQLMSAKIISKLEFGFRFNPNWRSTFRASDDLAR